MSLSNVALSTQYEGGAESSEIGLVMYNGLNTTMDGVLAIKGDGELTFEAHATAIDRREQADLVYADCESGAAVIVMGAAELNTLFMTHASFDTVNDKWVATTDGTSTGYTSTNYAENDLDYAIKLSDISSYYANNYSGASSATQQNDTVLRDYFINFVTEFKRDILIDGGEVLFTDETLVGNEFTSEDLAATLRYHTAGDISGSGMDALGSGNNTTDNATAGEPGLEGSTDVENVLDTLKILEVNAILRKMKDIGYNGRDASGSGMAHGSGAEGFIAEDSPWKAGDVIYFSGGLSFQAKVEVQDELLQNTAQLNNSSTNISSSESTITVGDRTFVGEQQTTNLFIQLV